MRLPDFRKAQNLNELRKKLNADLIDFSKVHWNAVNENELLDKLNSVEGILVENISDIIADDGTFEYKGKKVLIYIRDQRYNPKYGDRFEYKFHISSCDVIQRFIQNNRLNRYVVSTRTDGKFLVNIVDSSCNSFIEKDVIKKLRVCKRCLDNLNYKEYSSGRQRTSIYENFTLKEFFEKYQTNFSQLPPDTDQTAPPDLYVEENPKLAKTIKEKRGWKCENCLVDLNQDKNFLHLHHINGRKSDNNMNNLKCLCIKCHAEQPDHSFLKNDYKYKEFIRKYKC